MRHMKKLIAMVAIAGMLSGCGVMENLINPPLQSTTPAKPAKKDKMSDIGLATGATIGIVAAAVYLITSPIIDYLKHKTPAVK
jgi:hypothetical protein